MSSDIYFRLYSVSHGVPYDLAKKLLHVGIQFVHRDGMCFPLSLFSEFLPSPQLYYNCHGLHKTFFDSYSWKSSYHPLCNTSSLSISP